MSTNSKKYVIVGIDNKIYGPYKSEEEARVFEAVKHNGVIKEIQEDIFCPKCQDSKSTLDCGLCHRDACRRCTREMMVCDTCYENLQ